MRLLNTFAVNIDTVERLLVSVKQEVSFECYCCCCSKNIQNVKGQTCPFCPTFTCTCTVSISLTRLGEILLLCKSLPVFGKLLKVLVFSQILNLLGQIYYAIGQMFIALNCQALKNNLAIWSHWLSLPSARTVTNFFCEFQTFCSSFKSLLLDYKFYG